MRNLVLFMLVVACTTDLPTESGPPSPDGSTVDTQDAPSTSQNQEESSSPIATVRPLTPDERARMTGGVWKEDCPVPLDDLRAIQIVHHTLGGGLAQGTLVVHEDVSEDIAQVFTELHAAQFPITQIQPIEMFDGDDGRSMSADNTSAFNCRRIAGTQTWSEHASGRAIDLNPLRNPWVRGDRVEPPEGADYVERDPDVPGLIVDGDAVVTAFARVGWKWGGHWTSLKDYQHFSLSGR
jgi:hypothetical protein